MNTGRLPAIISASLLGFTLTAGGVAIAESANADTTTHSTTADPTAKDKKPKLKPKHHKLAKHHKLVKHHKLTKHGKAEGDKGGAAKGEMGKGGMDKGMDMGKGKGDADKGGASGGGSTPPAGGTAPTGGEQSHQGVISKIPFVGGVLGGVL